MKKVFAFLGGALLVIALAVIVAPSVALAHAQIASCTPPINGVVSTAPSVLTCKAVEAMDPKVSVMKVYDASGAQVDKGDSAVDLNDPDRETISVSLDPSKMKDGVYTVKWTTLSTDDGDTADGTFTFMVGAPTPAPTPTGTANTATPTPVGKIDIIFPETDSPTIAGPVAVAVAVEGVTLGDLYHWHLYLDDKLATMVEQGKDTTTINIPAGTHKIKVALADDAHGELATAEETVTVVDATPSPAGTMAATAMPAGTAMVMETGTPEATVMVMETGTPAPTAMEAMTPAASVTSAPAAGGTLPTTGGEVSYGLYALLAVVGLLLVSAGAFVTVRGRH